MCCSVVIEWRIIHSITTVEDWKIYVPDVGPSLSGPNGGLTDTGVWYVPKGSLVLYTAGGYEATGLVCEKCSSLATSIWPWIICGHCGVPLLEVVSPTSPPRALEVDWDKNVAIPVQGTTKVSAAITQPTRDAAPLTLVAAPRPGTPVISRGPRSGPTALIDDRTS